MSISTSIERRAIITVASIFSLRMLGLFMVYPVFAIYAFQLRNSTPVLVGLALGIYGLTQALFQIPFGFASDRLGRKPLIMFGLSLFILGSVIAALSDSIYGVVIGRCLQGMSAIGSVMMALVADLTRETVRARAMAVMGITIGLSFALAMVLGPVLGDWAGVQGIFWLMAVFGALAMLLLWVLVPDPNRSLGPDLTKPIRASLLKVLANQELLQLNLGVLVLHASLVALFLKIPGTLVELGFEGGTVWRFYLVLIVSSLLTAPPLLLWLEKKTAANRKVGLLVFTLLLSEGGFYCFHKSMLGVGISLWMFFSAFNCLEASLPSLVSKLASSRERGTALGIYSSVQFIGLFLGGLAGGWLDKDYGMVGVLGFCMMLAMGWLVSITVNLRGY